MPKFRFNISLSVLNHLGRNLYRSFVTVLGEAISNTWDADAKNVWITIDREKNFFVIKDDGDGMSSSDFRNKFLKVGYSKRNERRQSKRGRPYIGRKGIGKLALLSCAEKIHIISKKANQKNYIGGVIDNSALDKAIKKDSIKYDLDEVDENLFAPYKDGHQHGTIIYFQDLNEGIKNTVDHLRKAIALNFKFSLIDEDFKILVTDEKDAHKEVTHEDLSGLAGDTQFLWKIKKCNDDYINMLKPLKQSKVSSKLSISGFIASVVKPSQLNIFGTGEKIGIDLFVNGRLRETNILKHKGGFHTRHVASYLYGQIHFDELDDEKDRFTSSREGIVSNDEKFNQLLKALNDILKNVSNDWDKWRDEKNQSVDPNNPKNQTKKRKAKELCLAASKDFSKGDSPNQAKIDAWLKKLAKEAESNFSSYADCYLSENLVRMYVHDKQLPITGSEKTKIGKFKKWEQNNKDEARMSIELRSDSSYDRDLGYLSLDDLSSIAEAAPQTEVAAAETAEGSAASQAQHSNPPLIRDAGEYKIMRNALAHTALLTTEAKTKLTSVFDNIKARVVELLNKK